MISSRLLISPLPSLSIVSNRARSCASLSDVVAVEGFGAFVPLVVAFAFDTTATALLDDFDDEATGRARRGDDPASPAFSSARSSSAISGARSPVSLRIAPATMKWPRNSDQLIRLSELWSID